MTYTNPISYADMAHELNKIYYKYLQKRPFELGMPLEDFYLYTFKLIKEMEYVRDET